jgi:hypothetical protein
MRIRYADSALADLDAIHEYQAVHGPAARRVACDAQAARLRHREQLPDQVRGEAIQTERLRQRPSLDRVAVARDDG